MKILASDYDGTLNVDGIGDEKKAAIARWREAGNLFGIVSGRCIKNLVDFIRDLGLECDFLIGDNGASVARGNGEVLSEAICEGNMAREIIEYLISLGGDDCWVRPYPDRLVKVECETDDWYCTLDTMPEIEKFTQISTVFPKFEQTVEAVELLKERYGDKLNILQNGYCIDIVRGDINKAVGIYNLLDIVGGKYDDVITVGDNVNDADMIREFYSYAMDNAVPMIKELANRTTPSVINLIDSEI